MRGGCFWFADAIPPRWWSHSTARVYMVDSILNFYLRIENPSLRARVFVYNTPVGDGLRYKMGCDQEHTQSAIFSYCCSIWGDYRPRYRISVQTARACVLACSGSVTDRVTDRVPDAIPCLTSGFNGASLGGNPAKRGGLIH